MVNIGHRRKGAAMATPLLSHINEDSKLRIIDRDGGIGRPTSKYVPTPLIGMLIRLPSTEVIFGQREGKRS